jgi:DNA-binding NarL/FixJ family response regulator
MGKPMDVFIVENPASIRTSLKSVLSNMTGINVIGHAINEAWAVERIAVLKPDVVIMDIGLQSGSSMAVLENVKRHSDATKVVVFAHYTDDSCVERYKCAGADYFFDKTYQLAQLREILWKWLHTDRLNGNINAGGHTNRIQ